MSENQKEQLIELAMGMTEEEMKQEIIYCHDISAHQHDSKHKREVLNYELFANSSSGTLTPANAEPQDIRPVVMTIKATQGGYYLNPYYELDWQGFKDQGYIMQSYEFFDPWSNPKNAIYFFLQNSNWEKDDLPPLLDDEYVKALLGTDPDKPGIVMPPTQYEDALMYSMELLEKETGWAERYTNSNVDNRLPINRDRFKYPHHIAHYLDGAPLRHDFEIALPYLMKKWGIEQARHQFSNKGANEGAKITNTYRLPPFYRAEEVPLDLSWCTLHVLLFLMGELDNVLATQSPGKVPEPTPGDDEIAAAKKQGYEQAMWQIESYANEQRLNQS